MITLRRKNKDTDIKEFIESYKSYLIEQEVFKNEKEVEYFFTMGGCYMFGRILKSIFPKSKLMINHLRSHCTVQYNKKVYDIRGEVDNPFRFRKVSNKDITYMEDSFGFNKYPENFKGFDDFEKEFIEKTLSGFKTNTSPYISIYIKDLQ